MNVINTLHYVKHRIQTELKYSKIIFNSDQLGSDRNIDHLWFDDTNSGLISFIVILYLVKIHI